MTDEEAVLNVMNFANVNPVIYDDIRRVASRDASPSMSRVDGLTKRQIITIIDQLVKDGKLIKTTWTTRTNKVIDAWMFAKIDGD